jgi:GrpB-like predicted nucleotidyltransferase (UPF0157 family)
MDVIEIVEFDQRWPAEFGEIAAPLRGALGVLAQRIDHIGSTSVPGLAAKDRIDIQLTVADLDALPAVAARLESIGYTQAPGISGDHRPPGWQGPAEEWLKRFFRPPAGQRATNLHVRANGRANQRYALLFRDYLRAHPASAAAYAELKRRLAAGLRDPDAYPDVKDPVCDIIMCAAEDWARATDWAPGPSDA